MPVPFTKIAELINKNYDGLTVVQNSKISYVNLLRGRNDSNLFPFVCIQRKVLSGFEVLGPILIDLTSRNAFRGQPKPLNPQKAKLETRRTWI